jgi:hypothetical protein
MNLKESKEYVKGKYPRAVCGYYGCEQDLKTQKFAVRTYRCGKPITNTRSGPDVLLERFYPVTFPTHAKAWIAAARRNRCSN